MNGFPFSSLSISISRKDSFFPIPVPLALEKASFAAYLPAKNSICLCPAKDQIFAFPDQSGCGLQIFVALSRYVESAEFQQYQGQFQQSLLSPFLCCTRANSFQWLIGKQL